MLNDQHNVMIASSALFSTHYRPCSVSSICLVGCRKVLVIYSQWSVHTNCWEWYGELKNVIQVLKIVNEIVVDKISFWDIHKNILQ